MVDDVRRRVQQPVLGHRGRKGDTLYSVRRLLLRAADRLTARGWQRLEAAWDAGDDADQVYLAWRSRRPSVTSTPPPPATTPPRRSKASTAGRSTPASPKLRMASDLLEQDAGAR